MCQRVWYNYVHSRGMRLLLAHRLLRDEWIPLRGWQLRQAVGAAGVPGRTAL